MTDLIPLSTCLVLIPLLPLLAAIIVAALGPRLLKERSHFVVIGAFAASFLLSCLLVMQLNAIHAGGGQHETAKTAGYEQIVTLWTWVHVDDAFELSSTDPATLLDAGPHDFHVDIALRADALTAMMLAMVTFVSTLVAIFAAGYMRGDRSYWRFFAYVALFVFSMTMLVSVTNFALLFVFWEAVGVCSYLLIGFWYEKSEAAAAGMKAFLVNRVGDFGFALALFLIWSTYGTLNFHDTTADGSPEPRAATAIAAIDSDVAAAGAEDEIVRGVLGVRRVAANHYVGGTVGLAICLLLLLGACGKSAQFPLHVWLPDAMEGPTPVSALIHAATMVTAGVYMVARCTPLFMVSPEAQLVVACVGGFTALLAGLIALTQYDLKRVLAYSTVSQLGYMFMALGAGTFAGITAGMFHLFTHAFFKALLFLGAGSVMHAMGNVIDMRRFGGLRRRLPITHWTFFLGCLALAGVPPLAGFWSKDTIVAAVHERAHELTQEAELRDESDASQPDQDGQHQSSPGGGASRHFAQNGMTLIPVALYAETATDDQSALASLNKHQLRRYAWIYQLLYYVAMFTAFLTAFYTFRAFYLTFYGEERIPSEAGDHAHESTPMMWIPLAVLATCAVLAGLIFDHTYSRIGPTHWFAEFLSHAPSLAYGAVAATKGPYEFHSLVAGISSAIALSALLIVTYLYLGDRREILWLKSLFEFELFSGNLDVEGVSRWSRIGWVEAIHRQACAAKLGWLSSFVGSIVLMTTLVLTIPFLIGRALSPYNLSQHKFYIDEIYFLVIVLPMRALGSICYIVDRWLVDGVVNAIGRTPLRLGALMRPMHLGLVQFYALATVLAMLVLVAAKIIWAAG
ncbi:MAG TPA: NADH-quinone oxidoreductase subunit L [Pirellulaceae bacterium]|nr:NADH-quinone oxidoreductase subunit L [Pirellulaceae bacterium]